MASMRCTKPTFINDFEQYTSPYSPWQVGFTEISGESADDDASSRFEESDVVDVRLEVIQILGHPRRGSPDSVFE